MRKSYAVAKYGLMATVQPDANKSWDRLSPAAEALTRGIALSPEYGNGSSTHSLSYSSHRSCMYYFSEFAVARRSAIA